MKKILLVGQFTDYFREINKSLAQKYEVRACVNKLEIFRGMFKLNKPDIVVILLNEMNKTNVDLLTGIQEEYSETPVVCVGIQMEDTKIEELENSNFIFVTVPYTEQELMETVDAVLEGKIIPKAVHNEEEERMEKTEEENGEEEEKSEFTPERKKIVNTRKTILLVDDSGVFLRMLQGLLSEDYDIRMATSGLKALASIREKRPDLILLDYEMPMYDGRETMIKIRESEVNKEIPIVFVTAVNKREHIKSVLSLKPAGYLLKPIDRDRLFRTIKEIIG
ncbi:MAG: response regulator [Lachnospiraceae bacterium]|nr:response regulator [Lachnospiraceae bacterium]